MANEIEITDVEYQQILSQETGLTKHIVNHPGFIIEIHHLEDAELINFRLKRVFDIERLNITYWKKENDRIS